MNATVAKIEQSFGTFLGRNAYKYTNMLKILSYCMDFNKINSAPYFICFYLSGLFVVLNSVWVIAQKSSSIRSNDQRTIPLIVNSSYMSKTQIEDYNLLLCDAVQFIRSLHNDVWMNILASSSGSKSKVKIVCSSEISKSSTRVCYIREYSTLHSRRHENVKSQKN
jgi:hypothetical protein